MNIKNILKNFLKQEGLYSLFKLVVLNYFAYRRQHWISEFRKENKMLKQH